jgi:hypothetical protein
MRGRAGFFAILLNKLPDPGNGLRPFGSAHAFTPMVKTDGMKIILNCLMLPALSVRR